MTETQESESAPALDLWGIVELFGHNKIAGHLTEQTIAGDKFLRVDVPAFGEQKAFTRLFGGKAIYSINPTTEEIARAVSAQHQCLPVNSYELPKQLAAAPILDDPDREDGGYI